MSEMIRAAVALENLTVEVRSFDPPRPGVSDGILAVEMCGVCGSDWPGFNKFPKTRGPLILGHETVGFVEALGSDAARRWGVKEGDRVALEEYLPCGHCAFCRTSDFRLCDATDTVVGTGVRYGSTPVSLGPSLWGGYAEKKYLHPNSVFHKVPASLPATLATLALPLGNGFEWTYMQGGLRIGESVVIQGPGQQGLACVVAAKEAGAGCIIVSGLGADRDRLELAKALGAHHVVNVEESDLLEAVADATGGLMADMVIDCSSGGPATVTTALRIVRKAGRILLCGSKGRPLPEFDVDTVFRKNLTIRGLRGHSFQAVELALSVLASGRYPLDRLCTHVFGLDQVAEALLTVGAADGRRGIHVCVDPSR
jgi:threonine dehydrogenase-like Zn-dependent dehydrogenase